MKFKQKGDISASYGLDENGYSNYNIGYSFNDHLAIISDFKTFDTYSTKSDNSTRIDDYFWDNEIVLYSNFNEFFYPAINAGYGFGRVDRAEDIYSLKAYRQFIQPSLGYSSKFFDVAISTRLTRTNYRLKVMPRDVSYLNSYYELYDVGKRNFYFVEPALTLGVGYKNIKLRVQKVSASQLGSGNIRYYKRNTIVSINILLDKSFLKE
ncbi:MAG: hypothetical protein GY816_03635 [Cytophagales bacterium]|nr:hypothetical protein [Cytophagales bacterium]